MNATSRERRKNEDSHSPVLNHQVEQLAKNPDEAMEEEDILSTCLYHSRITHPRSGAFRRLMRIFGKEWGWKAEHQGIRLHGRKWIFTFFSAPPGYARHRAQPYFIIGDWAGREMGVIGVGKIPCILAGRINPRAGRYCFWFAKTNRRVLELHWRQPERWDSWTFLTALRIMPTRWL